MWFGPVSNQVIIQKKRGLAIFLTIFAGCVLGIMDALSKQLIGSFEVIQVLWSRYFFHSVIVFVYLILFCSKSVFISKKPKIQIQRSLALFVATIAMYVSLDYLPLADAASVQFSAPVLVTLISGIFLGEKIGKRRYIAVIVAFCGVLIIVQPGIEFRWAMLLPLIAAFMLAIFLIQTRALQSFDNAYTTLFYSTLIGAIVFIIVIPFFWRQPTSEEWFFMVVQGSLGAIGHLAIIKALKYSTASFLAPFLYSQLLVAIILSVMYLGDPVTIMMCLGAFIIMASGIYIWYREVFLINVGSP